MQINQIINNNGQGNIEEIPEENPVNNILLAIAQQSLIKDQKLEEKNHKYEKQIQLVLEENDGLKDEIVLLKKMITVLESKLSDTEKKFQVETETLKETIKEKEKQNLELEQKLKPYAEKHQTLEHKITELKKQLLQIESEFNTSYPTYPLSIMINWPPNCGKMVMYKAQKPHAYNLINEYKLNQSILDSYVKTLNSMDQIKK